MVMSVGFDNLKFFLQFTTSLINLYAILRFSMNEYVFQNDELEKTLGQEQEFIFLRLNVLREYLKKELRMDGLPFDYDFEVGELRSQLLIVPS
jgi:hypothetical protein